MKSYLIKICPCTATWSCLPFSSSVLVGLTETLFCPDHTCTTGRLDSLQSRLLEQLPDIKERCWWSMGLLRLYLAHLHPQFVSDKDVVTMVGWSQHFQESIASNGSGWWLVLLIVLSIAISQTFLSTVPKAFSDPKWWLFPSSSNLSD